MSVSLFWKKLPLSKDQLETLTNDLETLTKELVARIVKFVLSHEQDALRLGGLEIEDECLEQPLSNIGLDLLSAVYLDPQENLAGEAIVKSFPLDLQVGAQEQYNDLIERALEKKQRKLVRYRTEGAGEVWLLLVTGAGFNQPVIASLLGQQSFLSDFDRVYLLDLWSEQCLCLHST